MRIMDRPLVALGYWINSLTGQIYSARDESIIQGSNPTYTAWAATGKTVWPWPKDPSGNMTPEALDEILVFYGLPATGLAKPTMEQLRQAAWTKAKALLSAVRSYNVSGIVGTIAANGAAVSADMSLWGSANQSSVTQWTDDNYVVVELTGAQVASLGDSISQFRGQVYATLASVSSGISEGSIKTLAAVNSAAWPV